MPFHRNQEKKEFNYTRKKGHGPRLGNRVWENTNSGKCIYTLSLKFLKGCGPQSRGRMGPKHSARAAESQGRQDPEPPGSGVGAGGWPACGCGVRDQSAQTVTASRGNTTGQGLNLSFDFPKEAGWGQALLCSNPHGST